MPLFRRNHLHAGEPPDQVSARPAGARPGPSPARPARPRAPGLPDPTATLRPISLLLLSEDPTLAHALWNALVQTLGEAETMRRYELPRSRTDSGKNLLHVLQQGMPRADVVLVDVRAHAGLAELDAQHYQGFARHTLLLQQEGEPVEGILMRPPAVALAPNHPDFVYLNEDEERAFQPQWEQYLIGWGYAGALVFPDDGALLHQVLQEVLEQPVLPRVPLPPPPAQPEDASPEWVAQASPQRPADATAGPERLARPPEVVEPEPLTGLMGVPSFQGVLAVWSPFDCTGRTTAALELAAGLQLAGYPTLLGEFRRPFGFLAQKLTLDDQSFACSLLALAGAVNESFKQGGPFVLPRDAVQRHLLRGLPLYDLRRQVDGPRLEYFHAGFTARQEAYYELEVLQDPKQVMLRQLIEMLKEWPTFTVFIVGSIALDPIHFAALTQCDRLLICLPLDTTLFGVAVASIQLLLRHIPKRANNIDLCFTRWNQLIQPDTLPEVARSCYETGQLEERQLRKFLQALKVEREVEGLVKACGLSSIAAFLPDERPLSWKLARKPPLMPALLHTELTQDPYVLAIRRQLLPTYITLPEALSQAEQSKPRWGLFH